jgi:hypothetical protein
MALLHPRRLLALLAVLFTRSFETTLPNGTRVHVWPSERIVLPVISGADGEDDPEPEEKDEPEKDPEKDPEQKDPEKKDDDGPEKVDPTDDWKVKSRKNETRAKKAEREAKEAREALAKREEADKSESEKAVEKARAEGRKEALTEAEKERRSDRLEVAVTRAASKKVKVGSGDEAEEHRFADTEDALMHVERAISRGEIDEEDIFDKEGRVDTDALQKELSELLDRKPHLRESTGSEKAPEPKKGDPDTRKGDPAKGDLESMSPEDHAKRKYGASK